MKLFAIDLNSDSLILHFIAAPLISILKESESAEKEIVQRVTLFIITQVKDYLGLTVQYFHFQCNYILYGVLVNERYKSI